MKKKLILCLVILGIFLSMTGCEKKNAEKEIARQTLYFDTVISISFYADERGEEWMTHCMEMCEQYEKIFSRTREDSELYAVNHRVSDRIAVSPELLEVVQKGLEFYEISGGKFDITVAPLSDLWDFKSEDAKVPEQAEIEKALALVGADRVHVEGQELVFADQTTMIDLGALVKGYAADQIKAYLEEKGVTSGLINLGGNVLAIGKKPDGSLWKIGIQKPFASHQEMADTVQVDGQTVVSSGIYERCFEQDGRIYHHILDPKNGYPVENDIEGITIIGESSLVGDAFSTTCLLLGVERTKEIISEHPELKAVIINRNSEVEKVNFD